MLHLPPVPIPLKVDNDKVQSECGWEAADDDDDRPGDVRSLTHPGPWLTRRFVPPRSVIGRPVALHQHVFGSMERSIIIYGRVLCCRSIIITLSVQKPSRGWILSLIYLSGRSSFRGTRRTWLSTERCHNPIDWQMWLPKSVYCSNKFHFHQSLHSICPGSVSTLTIYCRWMRMLRPRHGDKVVLVLVVGVCSEERIIKWADSLTFALTGRHNVTSKRERARTRTKTRTNGRGGGGVAVQLPVTSSISALLLRIWKWLGVNK